ncbi:MAG: DUF1572 domain-containing protein [Sphingobacteriales bacterium]|nr:DUF1572 domain-containing protein [Sphingobacteriales bacterium]
MNTAPQIAKFLKDVHFGGNWTAVNLKDTLADVSWQQATTKVYSFNTIATLAFHISYYIGAITQVLNEEPLTAKDKYSFDHPPINCKEDWDKMLEKVWADAETFAKRVEQFPESKLEEPFADGKYGNYYRNLHGIIEHTHYHLGQIVLIKKLLNKKDEG